MKEKTKLLGAILIVVGAIVVLYVIAGDLFLTMRQNQILAEMEETTLPATTSDKTTTVETTTILTTTAESELALQTVEETSTEPESTLQFEKPAMVKGEDNLLYLGRIVIPSIDLNMPLVEGTTDTDIAVSAGHMIGTAYPNQIGNCVIVGHRGYSRGRLFNRLDEMKSGDEIITKVDGATTTYVVYDTKVVEPTDTSVINQTKDFKVLTLITCTPLYSSDYRIIVHAIKRNE